jgi:CheY-like chemotaxis protein
MTADLALTDAAEERSAASGLIRVLAAEDVAVNRELIRLILEPKGYLVDTVCDGIEAVEAVTLQPYDIVFMDMQMPGMDGMDATRAIRRLGGRYSQLPVVALSANIIADQVQLCLDAGMTAHIAKPFTSESLCAAIERWCVTSAPKNLVLESFVQQAGWSSVRSLLDMLQAQIAAFEACPQNNVDELGRHAHALRGAAGALGYGDLATVCRELEAACGTPKGPFCVLGLAHKATGLTKQDIARELARAA